MHSIVLGATSWIIFDLRWWMKSDCWSRARCSACDTSVALDFVASQQRWFFWLVPRVWRLPLIHHEEGKARTTKVAKTARMALRAKRMRCLRRDEITVRRGAGAGLPWALGVATPLMI